MYKRSITTTLKRKLGQGKALVLIGPRQVGKTTLIQNILEHKNYLFLNCDDPLIRELLTDPNTEQIKNIIGKHSFVFIDEAQRVANIGLTMKIITDQLKHVQLLISGSSALDLSNKLNESLTGRKREYQLLPISWQEFEDHHGYLVAQQQLEMRLVYGFYPEVLNRPGEEKETLKELVISYLYKDILAISEIRKPETLDSLVQALAFQVGSEVNYNELAQMVGIDKNTVANYIDKLCKAYVIFKVSSFSRNLRNEIKTSKKIYFYDNGIRNTIIGNFNSLNNRSDIGVLWENFLISERLKRNLYEERFTRMYFWRTKQQQEIDLVETEGEEIRGYEFKWNQNKKVKISKTFKNAYSAFGMTITKENFREFVMNDV